MVLFSTMIRSPAGGSAVMVCTGDRDVVVIDGRRGLLVEANNKIGRLQLSTKYLAAVVQKRRRATTATGPNDGV